MAQAHATLAQVIDATTGIAPELSTFPAAQGALWLEIAKEQIGLARWGTRASLGHMLLTAHLISASAQAAAAAIGSGSSGPIASESVGPASRSYAVAAASDESLSTTSYGREYMALRRVIMGRGSAVVGNSMIVQKA